MNTLRNKISQFLVGAAGAAMVEYAVALIVVSIVGGIIFAFGENIGAIIELSAGAF